MKDVRMNKTDVIRSCAFKKLTKRLQRRGNWIAMNGSNTIVTWKYDEFLNNTTIGLSCNSITNSQTLFYEMAHQYI